MRLAGQAADGEVIGELLTGEPDDEVVGAAMYAWIATGISSADIDALGDLQIVVTDLGGDLLGYVEDKMMDRGHAQLYSSSQADEPQPQAWHRHMGFKECGFIAGINGGGVGEVFFCKSLGPGAS